MGGGPSIPPVVSLNCPGNTCINTKGTFTATITNNQSATITFYFDGTQVQTNSNVTSESYTNPGIAVAGQHTVLVTAQNANGSSESSCTWNVYDPTLCIPQGQFITFYINQFRIGSSNWATAVCTQNALARWLYSSPNSSQFASIIQQFNWIGESVTCPSQNSTPPSNPNSYPVYVATIDGYDANGNLWEHAITAVLNKGTDPTNWSSYTFMQFDNNNIQIGVADTSGRSEGMIQIPVGYGSQVTTVTINQVTNLTVGVVNNVPQITPSYSPVAQFSIDNEGNVTYQNLE